MSVDPLLKASPLSPAVSACSEGTIKESHVDGLEDYLNMGRISEESFVGPAHVGSACLGTATSNLVLAVLGAGQLTLPYAMGQLGLGFGTLSLVVFTLLSIHSLKTLSLYELHFQACPRSCLESYSELVVRVLGMPGCAICQCLLVAYAWGGALSFMVILKSELAFLFALHPFGWESCGILLGIAVIFIWPLSSLDDLSALKKFSPLGCLAAIFITMVTLIATPWQSLVPTLSEACHGPTGTFETKENLRWYPQSFLAVAASLPLLAFALNSTWAYIPIFCTLAEKTPPRVNKLIFGSNACILLNYLLLSINGYATFCGRIEPNILDSLGSETLPGTLEHTLVVLAKVGLCVQLTLALPMRFFVARKTVGDEYGLPRVPVAGLLVGSAAAIAMLDISLATILGVTSSICASMIIYILPAIVDLKLSLPGAARKATSGLSLLVGIFILVAGLAANLMGVAVGS